jgi:DNA-binding transcriptional LysR family regulator
MQQRNLLPELNTFVLVAEHLSFRAAAERLELTAPAVSHSIRQLETRLGVRLLNRTTRSVALTQAGVRLLARLRPALYQIAGALEDMNEERQRPTGRLRIWAAPLGATLVVTPIWQRYLSTYPEVQLEVWTELGLTDFVASGFDAVIGPKRWAAPDMIKVRVTGPIDVAVVAAPAYFAGRQPPRMPEDLVSHNGIQYRFGAKGPVTKWDFERNGKEQHIAVPGRITVNTIELALRAALDGLGIARLPTEVATPFLRTGQLIRVLENWWAGAGEGFFLFYHGRRQVPAALRAFIDMVRAPKPGTGLLSAKKVLKSGE